MTSNFFFPAVAVLFLIMVLGAWIAVPPSPGVCFANPFTQKPSPEKQSPAPGGPAVAPGVSLTLVKWQQQLRDRMSRLIKDAKESGNWTPLLLVMATAFGYGVIHSAGPGHGKAVAASYVMGTRSGFGRGFAVAGILALTHAASGMILVAAVKFILHTGMGASLDRMTRATQVVSFSLILLIGISLFIKAVLKLCWENNASPEQENGGINFFSAVAMGLVPCPGVVMVMLFCLSMDAFYLGLALGLAIGAGMALTICVVTALAVLGKNTLVKGAKRLPARSWNPEIYVQAAAGLLVALLGGTFLFISI